MDKELKDRWVAALRSGEYKQGRGQLFNPRNDSYCCLGVLAHIIDPTSINRATGHSSTADSNNYSTHGVRAVGVTEVNEYALVVRNDSAECTFAQIADYIEKEL